MSKDDPWGEDWGSLRDAIAVVSERFTVRGAETKLRDMLASGDLPSTLQGMDGTREWLTGWGEESRSRSHGTTIVQESFCTTMTSRSYAEVSSCLIRI